MRAGSSRTQVRDSTSEAGNIDKEFGACSPDGNGNHFKCLRDCSFSRQISSIRSVSTTMRRFSVTVQGWCKLGVDNGNMDYEVSKVPPPNLLPHFGRPVGHLNPDRSRYRPAVRWCRSPGYRRTISPKNIPARGGRIFGQQACIGEYLAVSGVVFIEHHQEIQGVHEFQQMRQPVGAKKVIRQAPDMGVVYRHSRYAA